MKSIGKSFFLIIFLLTIAGGLFVLANPSACHVATERINIYIKSAKKSKKFSWVGNIFPEKEKITSETPILMYHHVKDHQTDDDDIEKGLSIPLEQFSKQMIYLHENNYQTISLDDLFMDDNENNIVLTFDDGYHDIYENAFPIMKKYNYTGTIFIITNYIGEDRYLDLNEIRELKQAGWQIESHTLSHPNLANISQEEEKNQISESKRIIEESVGNVVTFLSYPAGKYDDETIELTKKAGYRGAVTTNEGNSNNIEDIYKLNRERVSGYSEIGDFIGLLQ